MATLVPIKWIGRKSGEKLVRFSKIMVILWDNVEKLEYNDLGGSFSHFHLILCICHVQIKPFIWWHVWSKILFHPQIWHALGFLPAQPNTFMQKILRILTTFMKCGAVCELSCHVLLCELSCHVLLCELSADTRWTTSGTCCRGYHHHTDRLIFPACHPVPEICSYVALIFWQPTKWGHYEIAGVLLVSY